MIIDSMEEHKDQNSFSVIAEKFRKKFGFCSLLRVGFCMMKTWRGRQSMGSTITNFSIIAIYLSRFVKQTGKQKKALNSASTKSVYLWASSSYGIHIMNFSKFMTSPRRELNKLWTSVCCGLRQLLDFRSDGSLPSIFNKWHSWAQDTTQDWSSSNDCLNNSYELFYSQY